MANFLDDYEPVEDRLAQFLTDWPDARVVTVLVHHADGDYIVRAEVFTHEGALPVASGLAHDSEAQLPPNMKASALEVCETSAIGRALANCGYAAKGKRPSREEMEKTGLTGAKPSVAGAPREMSGSVAAGDLGHTPGPDPGPDSTPAASGEAVARPEPGEDVRPKPSPGSTKLAPGDPGPIGTVKPYSYSLDPAKCSHKFPSGRWLKWDAEDRCPRCGTPKVSAVEGTTADLGSA